MGHLLSSAIKMQGAAAAAPTIQIVNAGDLNNCEWFKNSVSQGAVTGTTNATLADGDTFYVLASNAMIGATIDYSLNGSYVTSYSDSPIATTPTFTAAAGNAYSFTCYGGL